MKVKSKKELKEDVEYFRTTSERRYETMIKLQNENYKLENEDRRNEDEQNKIYCFFRNVISVFNFTIFN